MAENSRPLDEDTELSPGDAVQQSLTQSEQEVSESGSNESAKKKKTKKPRMDWPTEVKNEAVRLMYVDGLVGKALTQRIKVKYDYDVNSEIVRTWAMEARKNKQFRFYSGIDSSMDGLELEVNKKLQTRVKLEVAQSDNASDVAELGAKKLLHLIQSYNNREVVHIGFAGGRTPSLLAEVLAELINSTATLWPARICFHSLVGVINRADPGIDPNTYPLHFHKLSSVIRNRLSFLSYPAPGILRDTERELVEKTLAISSAKEGWQPDIIVVSCGHYGANHNSFWDHINDSCAGVTKLEKAWSDTNKVFEKEGVIGDVGWFPVNDKGFVNFSETLPLWVSTLFSVDELFEFRRSNDTKCLLLAAPCGGRNCLKGGKGKILYSVLANHPHLVTHLVTDKITALELQMCLTHPHFASA